MFLDNLKHNLILVFLIYIAFFICGCQAGVVEHDEKVVAKVDDYEIYVSDFTTATSPVRMETVNDIDLKGQILEDLIMKKVLIREAQKRDFDKKKVFMRQIERYWEQALLRFLLKKKTEEISNTVAITEEETKNEYSKMSRKYFAEIVYLNSKPAALKLSQAIDDFSKVKQELKDDIISDQQPKWWEYGDLTKEIEGNLFSLKTGEISKPIKFGDYWVVVRVAQTGNIRIKPLEEIAGEIREDLARQKVEDNLTEWMTDLRNKADVWIDYYVLEEVDLGKLYSDSDVNGD